MSAVDSTRPYVVIPAGGVGTRLWPVSRARRPKFLHTLSGGHRSLLQATYDRLIPLTEPGRVIVVTGAAHSDAVAQQLPELNGNQIVAEPSGRDSCAAIGLAAAIIERRDPGAVMASFAADHLIRDLDRFSETVRTAVSGAKAGFLMTIGMTPTRPETGYGYVRCGAPTEVPGVRQVLRFEEKPPYELAAEYVSSGEYLWNASVFVWRTDAFLQALAQYSPDIHGKLTRIAAAWDSPNRDTVLDEVWPTVPRIAIEYAVMEPAAADGKVATVPGDFGWHDIGDFHTLGEILDDGARGPVVIPSENPGEVVARDTKGLVVLPGGGRLVAAVGVENLVIVDTGDAVLVCSRDRAQEVKALTDQLREAGLSKYL
jgi:mannose-1-phosphate guanylyltransferase